jgi:hypothetical protein
VLILGERYRLLTSQTLPVLQSARLEAAKPIRTFFTSCDHTYPDVIPAFSWSVPKSLTMDLPHSMSTRLAQDLGMARDDAVAFFMEFCEKFKVDLSTLHVRWSQHFSPEGSGSFGALIVLCLCVIAGFWVQDLIGILHAWGGESPWL